MWNEWEDGEIYTHSKDKPWYGRRGYIENLKKNLIKLKPTTFTRKLFFL